jgi:parvulin-like peptidyl-prolyl isomerase
VCWSAPIGVVQGPVQTEFGFHLILVAARISAEENEAEQKRESSKSK